MASQLYYFDSSALIKRYLEEKGSQKVLELWGGPETRILTSSITYSEIYAAIYRLQRDGELSKKQRNKVFQDFESDWRGLAVVDYSPEIRAHSQGIIEQVSLR